MIPCPSNINATLRLNPDLEAFNTTKRESVVRLIIAPYIFIIPGSTFGPPQLELTKNDLFRRMLEELSCVDEGKFFKD